MKRRKLMQHFMGGVATVTTPEESHALDQLVRAHRLKPLTVERAQAVVDQLKRRLPPLSPPLAPTRRRRG